MRRLLFTLALVCTAGACSAGCAHLLGTNATPQSFTVQSGIATTNDANLVAYLKEARAVNALVTPQPASSLADTGLGALIALATSLATYYQHRPKK